MREITGSESRNEADGAPWHRRRAAMRPASGAELATASLDLGVPRLFERRI